MGLRGPKPKIKSPRQPKRMRKGIPERPPELTGEAAAEWDRLVVEMEAIGVLAVVDRGILAAYCLAVADMLAAREMINSEGRFVQQPQTTSKGEVLGTRTVEHPAVKMLDKASTRVHKLASELGLTPKARERSEVGEAVVSAANPILAIRDRIKAARDGVS